MRGGVALKNNYICNSRSIHSILLWKKFFQIIFVTILIVACTSPEQEPLVDFNQDSKSATLLTYNLDEVIDIANSIAAELSNPTSRNENRIAHKSGIVEYHDVRSRADNSNFYVVNYDDNQGFAIISKYRVEDPVVAVINEGKYSSDDEIDNPGFKLFMSSAEKILIGLVVKIQVIL